MRSLAKDSQRKSYQAPDFFRQDPTFVSRRLRPAAFLKIAPLYASCIIVSRDLNLARIQSIVLTHSLHVFKIFVLNFNLVMHPVSKLRTSPRKNKKAKTTGLRNKREQYSNEIKGKIIDLVRARATF